METASVIEKTIKVLEKNHTSISQAVLVHALSVPDDEIASRAALSLLFSGSGLGKTEIIRNINRLSPEVIEEIAANVDLIHFSLHECLGHGTNELAIAALQTIKVAKLYEELPAVLQFMRRAKGDLVQQAGHIFESMIDSLYDQQQQADSSGDASLRNSIELTLNAIAEEVQQFDRLKHPRLLLQSIFILSTPGQSIPRKLIRESHPQCLSVIWNIFSQERHPGILHFLTDSLKQKYVHARILMNLSERSDIEFQMHLINSVPEHPSVNQERNYKRLDSLCWIIADTYFWDTIPEELQGNLVRLVELIGISSHEKIEIYKNALQFGAVEARKIAAEFRNSIEQDLYEQYITEALNSPDPRIEAWAVTEIKQTKLADKSRLLIERLDSPHEIVQQQAREALDMFDLQHAIEHCESAPLSAGKKIAELLLKINPDAIREVSRELASPIRTRRLRAAKAVRTMGLQNQVQEGLIELLYDTDPIIRRTVVEILAEAPTPQIISSMMMLLDDSNPRVRTTVEKELLKIRNKELETKTPS